MPKPYTPHDQWSRRAEQEGYRARSVYKLKELDEHFHLLRPGMRVLDCGAAPGSWLQYVNERIGPEGKAIGLDLQEIPPISPNIRTFIQDITDVSEVVRILKEEGCETVDCILSDAAPSTSGIKDIDQWQSLELGRAALAIVKKHLKPTGKAIIKVFRGADFDDFLRECKEQWQSVRTATVQASRDRSREVYIVLGGQQ